MPIVPGATSPIENAGAPVNGTTETQVLTVSGSPTGGTFKVTYDGFETASLTYNESAANVQTALRNLPNIGSTGCTVSGSAGGPWTVTFAGNLVNLALNTLTLSTNALTGGSSPSVGIAKGTTGVTATARLAGTGALLQDTTNGVLYINAGTGLAPSWLPAPGVNGSQTVQVTVPTASVLLLNTTPYTLVAAPGAGKIIAVDEIVAKIVFNSIAYTGANALEFRYTDGSGAKVSADIASTFINTASGTAYASVKGVVTALTPVANAALVVRVPTADPAAGNSAIVFTVKFRTLTP